MIILAIESSTTSAKAMLYDTQTNKIKMGQQAYSDIDNETSLNPDSVLKQTINTAKTVCAGHPVDLIVLSGAWHSVFLADRDFMPVTRAYQWNSTVASDICDELRKDHDFVSQYYKMTGCMVNSMYPYYKLKYLETKGYSLDEYYIFGQGDYNNLFLTDKFVTSECMASGTGLMNIYSKDYDEKLLKDLNITNANLPEVINYEKTYPLTKKAANSLGLKEGIPVVATSADGGLNQLGIGGLKKDVMSFSVGTSAALRLSVNEPILPEKPETWCYHSPLSYLSGVSTSGACNCTAWFMEKYFINKTYSEVDEVCKNRFDTPIFLPFVYGERSPGWRDDIKGGFEDIKPQHDIYSMYRSIMEGTLFNCYQGYEALIKLHNIKPRIVLSGGILYSPLWTQICVDIFGQEIEIPQNVQSSLLGCIVLGLHILNLDEQVKLLLKDNDIRYPNMNNHTKYQKKYESYLRWYNLSHKI